MEDKQQHEKPSQVSVQTKKKSSLETSLHNFLEKTHFLLIYLRILDVTADGKSIWATRCAVSFAEPSFLATFSRIKRVLYVVYIQVHVISERHFTREVTHVREHLMHFRIKSWTRRAWEEREKLDSVNSLDWDTACILVVLLFYNAMQCYMYVM